MTKASKVSAEIRNSRALRQKGLGARLRSARLDAEMSQRELAQALGTTVGRVCRWERGDTLEYSLLEKISRRCGVPIEYLLDRRLDM